MSLIDSITVTTKNKPTLFFNIIGYIILFATVKFWIASIIFILMITEINITDKGIDQNGK